jgi:hypothetical protein
MNDKNKVEHNFFLLLSGLDDWIYCHLLLQYLLITIVVVLSLIYPLYKSLGLASLVVSWQQIYNSLTVTKARIKSSFCKLTPLYSFNSHSPDWLLSLSLMLRPTVSRPVCLGIKHPSGAYDQICISVRNTSDSYVLDSVGRPLWRDAIRKFLDCYCYNCHGERRWEGRPGSHFHKPIASVCHVTPRYEHALFLRKCLFDFVFYFVCNGWQNQDMCLHEVLHEARLIRYRNPCNVSWGFWRTLFKPDSGFWMAFTFQGWSSVSWRWQTFRATRHQKMLKKFMNSSTKTVAEQSMISPTLLGSVMEFARRS